VCNSACGQIGDALDFVKWVRGCDGSEALRELRRFAGEPDNFARAYRPKHTQPEPTSAISEVTAPAPLDDAATLSRYLEGRGWPEWVAQRFGLSVFVDYYGAKRVRHPFYAFAGEGDALRVIEAGAQGRATDPREEVRWRGDAGRALPLYNLPALEPDTIRAVVLCEGPADTISATVATEAAGLEGVACVGVPGVQAWGTDAKAEWVKWLTGLRVIVAGDNDDAGQGFAKSVAEDLEGVAFGVSWLVASPGDDLSEMLGQVGAAEVGALIGWHLDALEAVRRV
jgi:DNA primase